MFTSTVSFGGSSPSPKIQELLYYISGMLREEARTETCFALSIGGASPNPMKPQLFDLVSFSPRGIASRCHRFSYGPLCDHLL